LFTISIFIQLIFRVVLVGAGARAGAGAGAGVVLAGPGVACSCSYQYYSKDKLNKNAYCKHSTIPNADRRVFAMKFMRAKTIKCTLGGILIHRNFIGYYDYYNTYVFIYDACTIVDWKAPMILLSGLMTHLMKA